MNKLGSCYRHYIFYTFCPDHDPFHDFLGRFQNMLRTSLVCWGFSRMRLDENKDVFFTVFSIELLLL